jgi:hypothetical protein
MNPGQPKGVTIPVSQRMPEPPKAGQPNTVQHVVEGKMVAVQYTDRNGTAHITTCFLLGGKLYHVPDGEKWSASLQGAQGWLQDSVIERLGLASDAEQDSPHPVAVPEKDEVDIV